MEIPQKVLEQKSFRDGYDFVIGVDEVGMGCLAGPVVVCAVGITKTFYSKYHETLQGLRESKLLSAKRRETFAMELLKQPDLVYSLSYCYPKTIDRLNIYQASRLAMRRSIKSVAEMFLLQIDGEESGAKKRHISEALVLVDGKYKIPGLKMEQMAIVKGDQKVFAIACASIIAKVYRDRMMARYARRYPEYGFEKHKGYGTKLHQAVLSSLGPTPIHRKSFAPVTKFI